MMQDYKKMQVWQKAHELTLLVYEVSKDFPDIERYSLVQQIRRACYSIPMNIAEGCGKSSNADLARFLDIASGSASELDYQLILVRDLDYITVEAYDRLSGFLVEIRKMLTNLITKVRE